MRPRYSFSSRRTRRIENIRKQKKKYPLIAQKVIEMSDIILEILDSRFPEKTKNSEIEREIKKQNKRIIYVLNKSDLIKDQINPNFFPFVFVSCKKRKGIRKLRDLIKLEAKKVKKRVNYDKLDKITIGIIGYPNTGKSSLINLLIGKSSAPTGAEAGFTKGFQKLKLTGDIQLIDSPGSIPEKKYSNIQTQQIVKNTLIGGHSYNQVKEPELVVVELMREYPNKLEEHYKISSEGDSEKLIEKIGRKKQILKKGGKVNEDQTARLILKDWQEGKIKI